VFVANQLNSRASNLQLRHSDSSVIIWKLSYSSYAKNSLGVKQAEFAPASHFVARNFHFQSMRLPGWLASEVSTVFSPVNWDLR